MLCELQFTSLFWRLSVAHQPHKRHKDFVTHNFVSDLIVITNKDTILKKHITKATFKSLLDTTLNKYATLLYPTLDIKNDSIRIHYSISIPVTDLGIGANLEFDKKGNYVIEQ